MLQTIREKAQGWIAWAIVILISIPFALWGIQQYLGVTSAPSIATVNGDELTERDLDQAYQQFRRQLRERFGSNLPEDLLDEGRLRREVLDGMIRERVIQQASLDLGLYAGDGLVRNAILTIPAFQKDGRFDAVVYERALQIQGYVKPAQFEERLRRSLVTEQLEHAVEGTEFISPQELDEIVRLEKQRRELSYLVVPADRFLPSDEISEADIETYYRDNQQRFATPERVRLDYLLLDADALGGKAEPKEEDLIAFYEADPTPYIGEQRREASHILVSVPEGADAATEEAARAKIEAAQNRIAGGETFADVAKDMSEDPGSAQSGGQLGFFSAAEMDPAFAEAAFQAEVGKVVGPVRTPFGYHLILVTAVEGEGKVTFEQARDQVLAAYRHREGEQKLLDYAERVSDLAYEHPDSLEPAAEALGLKVETSDWMSASGGQGVLASPKVVSAAFSEDVLAQGNNSELIELGKNQMLVLRVRDREEAGVKPLAEVKDEVVQALRQQRARDKATEVAGSLVQRLQDGASLADLAAEGGYDLQQPGSVERSASVLPAGLSQALFRMPRPAEGAASFDLAQLSSGDVAVIELRRVQDGKVEDLDAGEAARIKTELARGRGRDYYQELVAYLRSAANVTVSASMDGK